MGAVFTWFLEAIPKITYQEHILHVLCGYTVLLPKFYSYYKVTTTMQQQSRIGYITSDQKKEMVDFLEDHPELKSGKFTANFTFKQAQALWAQLSLKLNALPGAQKEWKQWRKTWQDLKGGVKKKNSMINRYKQGTGGGPPILTSLSDVELKIVDLIGTVSTEGDPDVIESQALFNPTVDHKYELVIDDAGNADNVNVDHDYFISNDNLDNNIDTHNMDTSMDIITETSVPAPIANTTPNTSKISQSKFVKSKKNFVRVQRLSNSIKATETLANLAKEKVTIKAKYYEEKIELYKRDIIVKERIASALEMIANRMNGEYCKQTESGVDSP